MEKAYLSLGSNRGDRKALLEQATDLLRQRVGSVVCCSSLYETAPWGRFANGEDLPFLNIAIVIDTPLAPRELLSATQAIEKALGRERPQKPTADRQDSPRQYHSRPIDIDIIFYGDAVLDTPDLTLPHPRMHLRRFVLQPLCEIAPDTQHPLLKKSIQQLLEECPDTSSLSCCS